MNQIWMHSWEYSENYYLNDKDMVKDWDMDLYHQIKDLKY